MPQTSPQLWSFFPNPYHPHQVGLALIELLPSCLEILKPVPMGVSCVGGMVHPIGLGLGLGLGLAFGLGLGKG